MFTGIRFFVYLERSFRSFIYIIYINSGFTFEKIKKQLYYGTLVIKYECIPEIQYKIQSLFTSLVKYCMLPSRQGDSLVHLCVRMGVCVTAILFCLSFSFSVLTRRISALSDRRRS